MFSCLHVILKCFSFSPVFLQGFRAALGTDERSELSPDVDDVYVTHWVPGTPLASALALRLPGQLQEPSPLSSQRVGTQWT